MNAPTTKPAKVAAKAPHVTVSLTITYPVKDGMTLADYAEEGKKAAKLVEEAKKLGTVTCEMDIPKQKVVI